MLLVHAARKGLVQIYSTVRITCARPYDGGGALGLLSCPHQISF